MSFKEGEHKQTVQIFNMFALFLLWQATKSSERTILPSFFEPQASLPSAAQPAVMDIRRLLALASDKVERGDAFQR